MKVPAIQEVKTEDEARQLAVEWQNWTGTQDLGWGDFAGYGEYFRALADKFHLVREFRENGII